MASLAQASNIPGNLLAEKTDYTTNKKSHKAKANSPNNIHISKHKRKMTMNMEKPCSDDISSNDVHHHQRKKKGGGIIKTLKVVANKGRRRRRARTSSSTTGNMMDGEGDDSFRSGNSNGSESYSRSTRSNGSESYSRSTRSSASASASAPEQDDGSSSKKSSTSSSSASSSSTLSSSLRSSNSVLFETSTRSKPSASSSSSSSSSRNSRKKKSNLIKTEGCSCSASNKNGKKNVQFHEIHVRDYERTISDNPSCSSGPPIGIGWSYGMTRTVTVNHYERERQQKQSNYPFGWHRRLVQHALVLSRLEREELLEEWNIPHSDIIKAVRANVKSKFDRRQTVRNTNKGVEKLELLFEGASKTLKRKLRLRKHTSEELKKLQEKVEQVASTMKYDEDDDDDSVLLAATGKTESTVCNTTAGTDNNSTASPAENSTSTTASSIGEGAISIDEPDDDEEGAYDWNDMSVVISDLCHSYPVESMVYANGESPTLGEDDDLDDDDLDDAATTMSGITFQSQATTISTAEMERFHRELEMEMFGYDDLPPPPQPIGQTLAVPTSSSSSTLSKPSTTTAATVVADDAVAARTTFDNDGVDTTNTPTHYNANHHHYHDVVEGNNDRRHIVGIQSNGTTIHHHADAEKDECLYDHANPQRQQRYCPPPAYYDHLCEQQMQQQQHVPTVSIYNQASGLFRGYSLHDAYSPGCGNGNGRVGQPQQQQCSNIYHHNNMPTTPTAGSTMMMQLAAEGRRDQLLVESRHVPMNDYPSPFNLIGDNVMMPLAYWRQRLEQEEEGLGSSLPLSLSEEKMLHRQHGGEQQPDTDDVVDVVDDDAGPTIKHLPFPVAATLTTTAHVGCYNNHPVTILEEA